MNPFTVQLLVKALQLALCHFFKICSSADECPDGICDDVRRDIDSLTEVPEPLGAPGNVQSFDFNIQWDELECLITSVKELIKCLRKFLGLDRTVG